MATRRKKTDNEESSSDEIQQKDKDPKEPPSLLSDIRYFGFVFSTITLWFIFILILIKFHVSLYLSSETVREMGTASIALATIPFAILSVLSALGRNKDEYYKVALAGIAVVFLITGFGCFMILWKYDVFPSTSMNYSVTMLFGFIGAFFIQALWSFIARRSDLFSALSNISINTAGTETFISVFSFVLSFLVVQVSAQQVAGGSLLFFAWFGFTGGIIALVVLTLAGMLSVPGSQDGSSVPAWAFNILMLSILFCSLAALFPALLSESNAPVETPTTIYTPTFVSTAELTTTVTITPTLSATSITTNTQEPEATASFTITPTQSPIIFADDFSDTIKTQSLWFPDSGSWDSTQGIYTCRKMNVACMSVAKTGIPLNTVIGVDIRGDFGSDKAVYVMDPTQQTNLIIIVFRSDPFNQIVVFYASAGIPAATPVMQDLPGLTNGVWFHTDIQLTYDHSVKIIVNDQQILDLPILVPMPSEIYVAGVGIPLFADDGTAASFDNFVITNPIPPVAISTPTP